MKFIKLTQYTDRDVALRVDRIQSMFRQENADGTWIRLIDGENFCVRQTLDEIVNMIES